MLEEISEFDILEALLERDIILLFIRDTLGLLILEMLEVNREIDLDILDFEGLDMEETSLAYEEVDFDGLLDLAAFRIEIMNGVARERESKDLGRLKVLP